MTIVLTLSVLFLGVTKPIQTMQELKCFKTLLVRSESLLRNAVHTNLTVSHSDIFYNLLCKMYIETTSRHTPRCF